MIVEQFSALIFAIVVLILLYTRRNFTTKVCLCDFKDYFYEFEKFLKYADTEETRHIPVENYMCHEKMSFSLNLMIFYEIFLTGLHFLLILIQYYSNINI